MDDEQIESASEQIVTGAAAIYAEQETVAKDKRRLRLSQKFRLDGRI